MKPGMCGASISWWQQRVKPAGMSKGGWVRGEEEYGGVLHTPTAKTTKKIMTNKPAEEG